MSQSNLSYLSKEEEYEEEDLLAHDDEGRKVINFRDIKEVYTYLCKSQLAEARNKMGKGFIENFQKTNSIRSTFKEDIPRPDNYKKMCELQLEEVKMTEVYQKLTNLHTKRLAQEGPKMYLCSKCGLPKKGHTCKANAEDEKVTPPPSRRRTRDVLPTVSDVHEGEPGRKKSRGSFQNPGDLHDERRKPPVPESKVILNPDPRTVPRVLNEWKFRSQHQILVVGGGIAGLTAARELRKAGFGVVVIEARDRIGGRIHTITSDDLKHGFGIDIGASFVYGVNTNPFIDLCKETPIPLHALGSNCVLYDFHGKKINPQVGGQTEGIFNECLNEIGKIRSRPFYFSRRHLVDSHFDRHQNDRMSDSNGHPLSQVLRNEDSLGQAVNLVLKQPHFHNSYVSEEAWPLLNWHLANVEASYGSDLSKLSLHAFDQDDTSPVSEGTNCLINQGYGHVINHLSQGLDVRLGQKVEKIVSEQNYARVETSKGIFEGSAVICTLPLGILKEGEVKFQPSLPNDKIGAINALGFGLVNKLILFFHNAFWDRDADYIGCCVPNTNTRGEFFLFINMEKVVGSPILVGMIAGEAAHALEGQTGEEVVGLAMQSLQKIYGKNAINPARAVVTRWAGDPFAKGAFSYLGVGCSGNEYDILSKPVGDRLYFAGEATNRQHPSTVAGAYLSGLRVASEIIGKFYPSNVSSNPMTNGVPQQTQVSIDEQMALQHSMHATPPPPIPLPGSPFLGFSPSQASPFNDALTTGALPLMTDLLTSSFHADMLEENL